MYGAILGDIIDSPYEFDRERRPRIFRCFQSTACSRMIP